MLHVSVTSAVVGSTASPAVVRTLALLWSVVVFF
jgi:hypothetical protein